MIAEQGYVEKCLQREYMRMSHADMLQARRDIKTMKKAYAITHDQSRKHNAEVLMQIENKRLKNRAMEGV